MSAAHHPSAAWRDASWRQTFRRRLLAWYKGHGRPLPWRKTHDPYRIWISEVMLQQTQVAKVIPYYVRFLDAFPTPADLAAADLAEVLRHWEGLGYYRRARQLHAAAQQIAARHGGRMPTGFEDVHALPGIGRYTAGAILSFSADQRWPIVEANTQRFYSRLMALREPTSSRAAAKLLWEFAEAILPPRRGSRQLNQALMELGSQVCTPRSPACDACPVQSLCAARALGLQAVIPGKVKNVSYQDVTEVAVAVRAGDFLLMRQRQPGERWAGLWDFPRLGQPQMKHVAADHPRAARQWVRENCADELGLEVDVHHEAVTIRHGVTRFRILLHCYVAHHAGRPRRVAEPLMWCKRATISELPLSVPARRLSREVAEMR